MGMSNPDTSIVQSPACTFDRTRTPSTLFRWSLPFGFGSDSPGLNPVYWFPRNTVPSGAVTTRSRSFTRFGFDPGVPAKSDHTRVISTGSEASPIASWYWTEPPVSIPPPFSSINNPRISPWKNIALSRSRRPQPWLKFGYRDSPLSYAPEPVISAALLISIPLTRAAEGVKEFGAAGAPVGYQP